MLFIFSTPELIRHLWHLKTSVFLNWSLICAVPLNSASLCNTIKSSERGRHWKGRQNKFSRIYCSYKDIFTVLTFRWCSKFPIDHFNKSFLLWIDFCGIMNCDTSSVAPSTISANVTNMLFHRKFIKFCIWGTVYWKKWVFQTLLSDFFVLKNTFHQMHFYE
jgi:hypothetical protein